jgi:hypothetical protein
MALQSFFIRVHPRQPTRGYRTSRFSIYGYLFLESEGWYRATFSQEQWEYLRNVRNCESIPDSKPVFDIVDEAGRRRMDEEARQAKIRELTPSSQRTVDLTTEDLAHSTSAVEAERSRERRVAAYDAASEVEDLAAPESVPVAPVSTSAPVVRRGRGRPRKTAEQTAVERVVSGPVP